MEQNQKCFICGKPDSLSNFGLWLVNAERHTVHLACWIATRDRATADEHPAA